MGARFRTAAIAIMVFTLPVPILAQEVTVPGWLDVARNYPGSVGIPLRTTEEMLRDDYFFVLVYNLSGTQSVPSFAFDTSGKAIAQFFPKEPARLHIWSNSIKQLGVGRIQFVLLNYAGKPEPSFLPQFSLRVGPKVVIQQAVLQIRAGQQEGGRIIERGSTAVNPSKGTGPFRITYQLNETASVTHTIVRGIDDEVWSESKSDVAKGIRGWEWNRAMTKGGSKAPPGADYRARADAVSVANPKVIAADGRSFEVIE